MLLLVVLLLLARGRSLRQPGVSGRLCRQWCSVRHLLPGSLLGRLLRLLCLLRLQQRQLHRVRRGLLLRVLHLLHLLRLLCCQQGNLLRNL